MRAIVVLLFVFGGVLSQYCRSPSTSCVPSYQCTYLQGLLKGPVDRNPIRFIRDSVCGRDHRGILVCCPRFYQNIVPETQGVEPTSRHHGVRSTFGPSETTRSTVTPSQQTLGDEDWEPSPLGQCGEQGEFDRIYGGQVTELDEFPWLALMFYSEDGISGVKNRCGGILLNRRYILTAAHCLRGTRKLEFIRLGEYNISEILDCTEKDGKKICADPPQDIPVEQIVTHPGYNFSMTPSLHDIAVIKLARRVQYNSYVQPICLPEASTKLSEGDVVTIAGWGKSYPVHDVPVKQKVQLPIFDHAACAAMYLAHARPFRIARDQICAGGEFSKDACVGDSGMPLMYQAPRGHWEARGVMSFGLGCGMDGVPGVYTDVRAYLDWIRETMKTSYSLPHTT